MTAAFFRQGYNGVVVNVTNTSDHHLTEVEITLTLPADCAVINNSTVDSGAFPDPPGTPQFPNPGEFRWKGSAPRQAKVAASRRFISAGTRGTYVEDLGTIRAQAGNHTCTIQLLVRPAPTRSLSSSPSAQPRCPGVDTRHCTIPIVDRGFSFLASWSTLTQQPLPDHADTSRPTPTTTDMATRKLPSLTPLQVISLQDALLANADRLLTSALTLLEAGDIGLARSLAILGMEESGKAIALHRRRVQIAYEVEGAPFVNSWLEDLWASHQAKLELVHDLLEEQQPVRSRACRPRSEPGRTRHDQAMDRTAQQTQATRLLRRHRPGWDAVTHGGRRGGILVHRH